MFRSDRSVPNADLALVPALAFIFGMVIVLAVAGYWLMKPTVLTSHALAAVKLPASVLSPGPAAEAVEVASAVPVAAEVENRTLEAAPFVLASAESRPIVEWPLIAAAPSQTTNPAPIQKRHDAPSRRRVSPSEPPVRSAAASWQLGLILGLF